MWIPGIYHLWTGKPPWHWTRHPGLLSLSPPSVAGWNEYLESWGRKQAYRVIHQPVSVVLQCSLNAWLKGLSSGDQHRFTGSGNALEACLLYLLTYCTCKFELICSLVVACRYGAIWAGVGSVGQWRRACCEDVAVLGHGHQVWQEHWYQLRSVGWQAAVCGCKLCCI